MEHFKIRLSFGALCLITVCFVATLKLIGVIVVQNAEPKHEPAEQIEAAAEVEETPAPEATPEIVPTEAETEAERVHLGNFKLTAYCSCEKCCGVWATRRPKDENGNDIVYTSTGAVATAGRTIAVDPSVIPYGSEVEINGKTYIAEDCGGAIKQNRIDVYFDNHAEALIFGVQYADIYLTA